MVIGRKVVATMIFSRSLLMLVIACVILAVLIRLFHSYYTKARGFVNNARASNTKTRRAYLPIWAESLHATMLQQLFPSISKRKVVCLLVIV